MGRVGTTKPIHIRGTWGGRAAKEATAAVVPGEISKQEMLQPRRRGLAQGGGSRTSNEAWKGLALQSRGKGD